MIKGIAPKAREKEVVIQELNGEVLIYDLKTNKAFCLNETSASVWQLCDGETSVNEISQKLGGKLNKTVSEDLVWLAIDGLKKENLIANGEELISSLAGLNRREAIKKVGLASMIALPIVAGIVAPSALHAASALCPVSPGNDPSAGGSFRQGQGGFCLCNSPTVTGTTCTPNPTARGDQMCFTGCRCVATDNFGDGTCQQ